MEGLERLLGDSLVTVDALTGRRGVEGLERLLKKRRGFSGCFFGYLWCLDWKERGEVLGATAKKCRGFSG